MPYYHDLITAKSWQVLQRLKKEFDFVLIGGWAVWLYARTAKSKDIDLVVEHNQLDKLKQTYGLSKNQRLKKYEFKVDEISIDTYVPFFSDLGIPAEEIRQHTQSVEGFVLPAKEILLILKQVAYAGRRLSIKGRKDMLDIFSLILLLDFDWKEYYKYIKKYKLIHFGSELSLLIRQTTEISELGFNRHQFSRKKKVLMEKIANPCTT